VQVRIAVRHGYLSEDTQALIREKAEKLVNLFDRLTLIEVTVDLKDRGDRKPGLKDKGDDGRAGPDRRTEEDNCRVELLVQAEHKHDIVAHTCHKDVLAAVDLTLDKVQAQLRRYKEKIQDRRRRPSTGDVAGAPSLEESSDE
jgi:putative sigma-54 modulation protein